MKIYMVVMGVFDGDHDWRVYSSPGFSNREAAQAFLLEVKKMEKNPDDFEEEWPFPTNWDGTIDECRIRGPYLEEVNVFDKFKEVEHSCFWAS